MNWINRLFDFFSIKFAPASTVATVQRDEKDEVLSLLKDYFDTNGGIAKVIKRFESAGFKGKLQSWISGGPNLTVNSVEVLQLIGWQDLRKISKKADIPVERLRDLLADLLPLAVCKELS